MLENVVKRASAFARQKELDTDGFIESQLLIDCAPPKSLLCLWWFIFCPKSVKWRFFPLLSNAHIVSLLESSKRVFCQVASVISNIGDCAYRGVGCGDVLMASLLSIEVTLTKVGSLRARIKHSADDALLPRNVRHSLDNDGNLRIRDFMGSVDAGDYTCVVKSRDQEVRATTQLVLVGT